MAATVSLESGVSVLGGASSQSMAVMSMIVFPWSFLATCLPTCRKIITPFVRRWLPSISLSPDVPPYEFSTRNKRFPLLVLPLCNPIVPWSSRIGFLPQQKRRQVYLLTLTVISPLLACGKIAHGAIVVGRRSDTSLLGGTLGP